MSTEYRSLPYTYLEPGTTFCRPRQDLPETVTLDSPAYDVMTDLSKVAAVNMGPCVGIDAASDRMVATGVRLLFVVDQQNTILGLFTSVDLATRPMQYLKEHGGKREDIFLRDIMTPQDRLEVLSMSDVARASVGDIVATLKRGGRQHALVADMAENGKQIVRGLFSATQISKQLGETIQTLEVAKTFAEVGQMKAAG